MFARCWLLVEGETETVLFAGVADALGIDLERAGVRIVQFGQSDVGMFGKVANQLGIPWYGVVDDDSGAGKYRNAARAQLGDAAEADRLILPYENVELFLCESGFGGLYESYVSPQKGRPSAPHGSRDYWRQVLNALPRRYSKPAIAAEAVWKMKESSVPQELRRILEKATQLATG